MTFILKCFNNVTDLRLRRITRSMIIFVSAGMCAQKMNIKSAAV